MGKSVTLDDPPNESAISNYFIFANPNQKIIQFSYIYSAKSVLTLYKPKENVSMHTKREMKKMTTEELRLIALEKNAKNL